MPSANQVDDNSPPSGTQQERTKSRRTDDQRRRRRIRRYARRQEKRNNRTVGIAETKKMVVVSWNVQGASTRINNRGRLRRIFRTRGEEEVGGGDAIRGLIGGG